MELKNKIIKWYQENKTEAVILFIILAIGAFFRLYRISDYMTFLGDEGRDAILVRRFLVNGDLMLIGPGTSIGNMYIGPLYYYLISSSLLLANFSPVGPSVFVALIGLATIWLVYYVGREWFPPSSRRGGTTEGQVPMAWGALIAAWLFAISPVIIIYSRSSWNPNVMPFFSLLTIFSLWKVWFDRAYKWMLVMAVSYAFVLQSHWLGLLLAPVIALFLLVELIRIKWGGGRKKFIAYSIWSIIIFSLLMSPLLIFDIRHGWINFNAMKTFFTVRQTTVSARPWNALPDIWPLLNQVVTSVVAGGNVTLAKWISIGIVAVLLWISGVKKIVLENKEFFAFLLIVVWLGTALLGLGVYKQNIYDHYFGFIFAAPILLIGGMIQDIIEKHKIRGIWIALTALVFISYYNLANNPLKNAPNKQLSRTREVAELIRNESRQEEFNLAVIAERNYEDAYQYFLERWNTGVVDIDPLNSEETITKQLFVVCELPAEKCDPTHNPKAEVANFGWSKIENEWETAGVIVYKLVHTQ